MHRLAAILCSMLVFVGALFAQDRHANVKLGDGRELSGRVLAMNVEQLELEVDGVVVVIAAADLRSCQFFVATEGGEAAGEGGAPAEVGEGAQGAGAKPGSDAASNSATGEQGVVPSAVEAAPAAQGAKPRSSPGVTWSGPLPDPIDPTSADAVPVDLRNRTLWRSRIEALDAAFPWLQPGAPTQWISLGLLLFVGLGLMVHLSVRVSGGEAIPFGRSVLLGIWYLITGLGQVALVPVTDFNVALMILGNTSLALFSLCTLFGLPRWGAIVALVIQLGFGVLVYGVLELVTALLSSCGVTV